MTRFNHLKNNRKAAISRDEFINNAGKDHIAKKAKRKIDKKEVLLNLVGELKREECGKPFLICLRKDLAAEMERFCLGSRVGVINFLVQKGLDTLKEKGEFVLDEI